MSVSDGGVQKQLRKNGDPVKLTVSMLKVKHQHFCFSFVTHTGKASATNNTVITRRAGVYHTGLHNLSQPGSKAAKNGEMMRK